MPSINIQADVSVETTGSRLVRREVGQAIPDVGPSQVYAVVAKEHAVTVRFVVRAPISGGLGRPDLHTSAELRKVNG